MGSADIFAFLRDVPLFRGIPDAPLMTLAEAGKVRSLPKGKIVFDQSSHSETTYLVHHGCIDLVLSTPEGRELVIGSMRRGDLFGELGVLTGGARSAQAMAREASDLISIPGQVFLAELEKEPLLMRRMLELTSERLQLSSQRESALAFMDAPARVALALIQLSEQEPNTPDLVTISQNELAQHVGTTRQTAASILGRWRRRGWIITGRGKIMLVDRASLRREAGAVSND